MNFFNPELNVIVITNSILESQRIAKLIGVPRKNCYSVRSGMEGISADIVITYGLYLPNYDWLIHPLLIFSKGVILEFKYSATESSTTKSS